MINTKFIFLLTIAFLGSSKATFSSDESSSSDGLDAPAASSSSAVTLSYEDSANEYGRAYPVHTLTFDRSYPATSHAARLLTFDLGLNHSMSFNYYASTRVEMAAGAPPPPPDDLRLPGLGFLKGADQRNVLEKANFSNLRNLMGITPPVKATFSLRKTPLPFSSDNSSSSSSSPAPAASSSSPSHFVSGLPALPKDLVKEISKFLPEADVGSFSLTCRNLWNNIPLRNRSRNVSTVQAIQGILSLGLHFDVEFEVNKTAPFNQIVPLF